MSSKQVEVDLEIRIVTPCCQRTVGTSELGMNLCIESGTHEVECPKCNKEFTLNINEPY